MEKDKRKTNGKNTSSQKHNERACQQFDSIQLLVSLSPMGKGGWHAPRFRTRLASCVSVSCLSLTPELLSLSRSFVSNLPHLKGRDTKSKVLPPQSTAHSPAPCPPPSTMHFMEHAKILTRHWRQEAFHNELGKLGYQEAPLLLALKCSA